MKYEMKIEYGGKDLKDVINNSYFVDGSMGNFSKEYLFKKDNINRWEISKGKVKQHKAKGYSDHLPIMAEFKVIE